MHSRQIFLRQIQDEVEISSLAVLASRPRTQTHVLAARSVQHRARTEVHQKADRYANIDHDKGHGPQRPRQGARDKHSGQTCRFQHRRLRSRVRVDHQQQHDGSARSRPTAAEAAIRRKGHFVGRTSNYKLYSLT